MSMRWLRSKEVAAKLSLSATGFKMLREKYVDFPKPTVIGPRHVVFDELEVDNWMKNQSDVLRHKQEVTDESERTT